MQKHNFLLLFQKVNFGTLMICNDLVLGSEGQSSRFVPFFGENFWFQCKVLTVECFQ